METKKLKKKIRELKQEISYLNNMLMEADDGSWDNKGLIEDALNGTWNGQHINEECKPDLKYAKWLANRYGYEIIKDEDGDMEVIEPDLKYAKWLANRYGYEIIKDEDGDMEVIEQEGGGNSSQA